MTLRELALLLPGSVLTGGGDGVVTEVTHDSRRVAQGALFVAIRGYAQDGNAYVEAARVSGASHLRILFTHIAPNVLPISFLYGSIVIGWAIFTSLMLIAALRTTVVLAVLFVVLDATFVLLGLGAIYASSGLTMAGGGFGLLTAALAWYLCVAGVTASTFGKPILPNPSLSRL